MKPRTQMLALMLIACCPATWAADLAAAQVVPMMAQLRTEGVPLDRQVAALQQQVAVLQAQVNALLAAVNVTETGVTLQGPAVTIAGAKVELKADGMLILRGNDLTADIARNANLRSGFSVAISSNAGVTLQAGTEMAVNGSRVLLNGGTRPIATVGSLVQPGAGGANQVITGSTTVRAD